MKNLLKYAAIQAFLFAALASTAQIKIAENTANSAAMGSSAFIDASSNPAYNNSENVGKGLLYPRVDLTTFTSFGGQPKGIPTSYPTYYDGFTVYNTASSGVAGIGSTKGTLTRGFWYYDNPTTSIDGGTWKPMSGKCKSDNTGETPAAPAPAVDYSSGDYVLYPTSTDADNPAPNPVTLTAFADGALEYEWLPPVPATDNSPADGLSLSASGATAVLTGSRTGFYYIKVRAKMSAGYSEWKIDSVSVGCGVKASATRWLAFLCYNLGANPDMSIAEQKAWLAATNSPWGAVSDVAEDSTVYGVTYQWGRPTDGHELRNSPVTQTLATSTVPGHGNFIESDYSHKNDWLDGSGANDRWGDGTEAENQAKAANDPCPAGWKVPSQAQWLAVADKSLNPQKWADTNTPGRYFGGSLFLPAAGIRYCEGTLMYYDTPEGHYWSSVVSGDYADSFFLNNQAGNANGGWGRHIGLSVRCVIDDEN
ncbi:MAG: fibrobacter succinogenes major paralogous domain-containing protein [Dysgonamonadaceae bacterium]|nr:fibrobacter succinogenes major paralogous domain-containing protein [Dysgonamonadaceae bacterium]